MNVLTVSSWNKWMTSIQYNIIQLYWIEVISLLPYRLKKYQHFFQQNLPTQLVIFFTVNVVGKLLTLFYYKHDFCLKDWYIPKPFSWKQLNVLCSVSDVSILIIDDIHTVSQFSITTLNNGLAYYVSPVICFTHVYITYSWIITMVFLFLWPLQISFKMLLYTSVILFLVPLISFSGFITVW